MAEGDTSAGAVEFAALLARVRAGEARAAEALVRRYELVVRVAVRTRLTDPALRRQFDSLDVCQSVMASFFVRAASGQYDLREPAQLVALLVRMAQKKLAMQIRHHRRHRRDARRTVPLDGASAAAAAEPGPDRIAAGRDLLSLLWSRLTADERGLVERRSDGRTWFEIADEFGGTPQARRQQLRRAINRVAPALGLESGEEEAGGE
jgi:RNA polymerase sigma factor (sigma-70 family)